MKKLIKNASWYLIGSILTNAIGFLFIPVITNEISTDDFGRLSLILLIVNFATPLINFGTSGAVTKQFYQLSPPEAKKYIFNASLVSSFFFLVSLLIFLVAGYPLSRHFGIEFKFLMAVPFIAFGGVIQQFLLAVLRIHGKPIPFSVISILGALLNFSLGYFFVVTLQAGWEGRLSSLVILNLFLFAIAITYLLTNRYLKLAIDKAFIKEILHFGGPVFIHLLSTSAITFTDQVFISILLDSSNLGLYSLAARLVFPISVVRVSILNAIDPIRYELLTIGDEKAKIKLVKILSVYMISIVGVVMITSVAYYLAFPLVFTQEYQPAFVVILPLISIVIVDAFYNAFTAQLYFLSRTKIFMYASFFNVAVNVVLNYLLISRYGIMGAAITTLSSKILFASIIMYVSHKAYQLPWTKLLTLSKVFKN